MNISQHLYLPTSFEVITYSPYNQFIHIFGLHSRVRIFNGSSLTYNPVIYTNSSGGLIANGRFNYLYNFIYAVRNSVNNRPYPNFTLMLY